MTDVHVVTRLEERGFIERTPDGQDRRAINARITARSREKVVATAPGHVQIARDYVIDSLRPEQIAQLDDIARPLLTRLDPDGHVNSGLTARTSGEPDER